MMNRNSIQHETHSANRTMATGVRRLLILITVLSLYLAFAAQKSEVLAAVVPEQQDQGEQDHGNIDLLKERVAQSSSASRLLALAKRQFELGHQTTAFEALQALFESADSQLIDLSSTSQGSAHQAGIALLTEASYSIRSAWCNKMEPIALASLQFGQSNTARLQETAQKFPLTQSGLNANLILLRILISRHQLHSAAALLQRLQARYQKVTVPFSSRLELNQVADRIEKVRGGHSSPSRIVYGRPKQSSESTPGSWSPAWRWQEDSWANPETAATFSGLSLPIARTDLISNSWRPVIDGNRLLMRTPGRIVSIDLDTGIEQWSLKTQTANSDSSQEPIDLTVPLSAPSPVTSVLKMNDLGCLSTSPDFAFFIDDVHFFQGHGLSNPTSSGNRLVAVRLTSPPSIAWTVGSPMKSEYEIRVGKASRVGVAKESQAMQPKSIANQASKPKRIPVELDPTDRASARSEVAYSLGDFDGHRFLGPPLPVEQNLYCLTTDGDSFWLNSLAAGTGRLSWRRLIAHTSEEASDFRGGNPFSLNGLSNLGASLAGIHENTILCLLNSGIVIGASLPDGQIQWATSLKGPESDVPKHPDITPARWIALAPAFAPILHDGKLVWTTRDSNFLSCMNASSGEILWQIPKASAQPGFADQSSDLNTVGLAGDSVVLTGQRHLRSIRLTDGSVNWTTAINGFCGDGIVIGPTCWIPSLDGSMTPFDTATGRKGVPQTSTSEVAGSLFFNSHYVLSATPLSIQAFARQSKSAQSVPLISGQQPQRDLANDQASSELGGARLVSMNHDWKVRADIVNPGTNGSLSSRSPHSQFIRQPAQIQHQAIANGTRSLPKAAQELAKDHDFSGAELCLLIEQSRQNSEGGKQAIRAQLAELRGQPTEKLAPRKETKSGLKNSEDSLSIFDTKLKFKVEEDFYLQKVSSLTSLVSFLQLPIKVATHDRDNGRRLYLRGRGLQPIDLNQGTLGQLVNLSATPDRLLSFTVPMAQRTPSLIPIVANAHVGVISVVDATHPQQLWWRRWNRAPFDNSPLRSGPITSSGLIFFTSHRITCLQPLTGHVLWQQDCSTDTRQSVFAQQKNFAADTEHLVALSPGYRSGTIFRMSDGRQLGTQKYHIPHGIHPVASGTRLLFPVDSKLKLIDMVTSADLLEDANINILSESSARLLSQDRAVILTEDQKLVILNLHSAEIEFSAPLPVDGEKQHATGFQTFEQNGFLYVHLRQWKQRNQDFSANSVLGDRRLTAGLLMSFNKETKQSWLIQNPTSAMMELAGDPSPFLVFWTRVSQNNDDFQIPFPKNRKAVARHDRLLVRIINRNTGKQLFMSDRFSWADPLRCVHDAESQTILIETEASDIRLRYTAEKSTP